MESVFPSIIHLVMETPSFSTSVFITALNSKACGVSIQLGGSAKIKLKIKKPIIIGNIFLFFSIIYINYNECSIYKDRYYRQELKLFLTTKGKS